MSPQGDLSVSGSEGKPVPVPGALWVRLTKHGLVQLSLWPVLLMGVVARSWEFVVQGAERGTVNWRPLLFVGQR